MIKDSSEVGHFLVTVPLSLVPFEFVLCLVCLVQVAFSLAVLGRALLALGYVCVSSGRGGRFPVEPWARLHCSELYWRCPVMVPAVQSAVPECRTACQHGSVFWRDVVILLRAHSGERGPMWDARRTSGTPDLLQLLLGRWHLVINARQCGAGTANLVSFSSLWLEHDCHARAAQLCTGRQCRSLPYSSAMTVRREFAFCGNHVPLAPLQVLLASYSLTACDELQL